MRGKFGPNTGQVESFLAKVRSLTAQDWEQVRAQERLAQSAYGCGDWSDIEITAYRSLGQRNAERLLRTIEKQVSGIREERDQHAATTAAICLALAGELGDAQVFAGYGPFTKAIPVADLGPGRTPSVEAPPPTPWGCFVKRVCTLADPEREQIVKLACSVERAVGVDGIDRAIAAANPADPEFFLVGMKESSDLWTHALIGRSR